MSHEKRAPKVNLEQKNCLLDYLEAHPNLITGKFDSNFTYKKSQELWAAGANLLNTKCAPKLGKGWKKLWQDMKCDVRKKCSAIRNHNQGTGGGQPSTLSLSDLEERIREMVGEVSINGHDVGESISNFNFEAPENNGCQYSVEFVDYEELSPDLPTQTVPVEEDNSLNTETAPAESISNANATAPVSKARPRNSSYRCLESAQSTADAVSDSISKKLKIKNIYYRRKLKIMQQDVVAKQKIAKAIQLNAVANFKIAKALNEVIKLNSNNN